MLASNAQHNMPSVELCALSCWSRVHVFHYSSEGRNTKSFASKILKMEGDGNITNQLMTAVIGLSQKVT